MVRSTRAGRAALVRPWVRGAPQLGSLQPTFV